MNDPDGLAARLPAMAVRAAQHTAPPPVRQAIDVGKPVDQAGGHEQAPGPHPPAAGDLDAEHRIVLLGSKMPARPGA
jgi:hypothetical protein